MNPARSNRAYTLIEIMLVVAIMGLILLMGVPAIYSANHRPPMIQAIVDVTEGCRQARALAILQSRPAELRIYPQSRRMEVASAVNYAVADLPPQDAAQISTSNTTNATNAPKSFSAQLSDRVIIEMLRVNFSEFKDADVAHVLFYPNGTSDEFTLVLHADGGEWKKISLEVATALPEVGPVQ